MVGIIEEPSAEALAPVAAPVADRAGELAACAAHLEVHGRADGLATRVAALAEAGDRGGVVAALSEAFIAALGPSSGAADGDGDGDGDGAAMDGCFQVLLAQLKMAGMEDAAVKAVAEGVGSGDGAADLRLKCVALLYNLVGEERGALRCAVLRVVVEVAAKAGLVAKIVETVLPNVDRFLKQWGVGVEEKREMYRVCCDALVSADLADHAFSFNCKRLELYNGAGEAELDGVRDAAVAAIVDAVRLPNLYRFDTLLELSAVKRLDVGGDQEMKLLFELLNIFVKDDLDVFMAFVEKNASLLEKRGIEKGVAVDKMRLLTFASQGIDSQDLSYEAIASALHVELDDVEGWIIRAISSGLVDAKINQIKSSVAVYRSTQRMFTREEWQPLSERINIWKANIGELLEQLRETRTDSQRAATEAFSG